jgi:hypothetical protein
VANGKSVENSLYICGVMIENLTNVCFSRLKEETMKKTVRICSVEEEIRIESFDSIDVDEWIPFAELQEVQLVTAKILTAQEVADSITRRDRSSSHPLKVGRNPLKGHGNTKGKRVPRLGQKKKKEKKRKEKKLKAHRVIMPLQEDEEEEAEAGGVPRPATDKGSPEARVAPSLGLKPSASENAIAGAWAEDNMISEKNIKPEILMDLSRVTDDLVPEQREQCLLEDELLVAAKPKRKLSRVSSDSACGLRSELGFHLGAGARLVVETSSGCGESQHRLEVESPTPGKLFARDSATDNKSDQQADNDSAKKWTR